MSFILEEGVMDMERTVEDCIRKDIDRYFDEN